MRRPARVRLALVPLALAACAPIAGEAPPARSSAPGGWTLAFDGDVQGFLDCVEAAGASVVSAHRGGPRPGFPENAVETFAETLRLAPALVELDVATSADGVLYLMHDDTLERTTTGEGPANGLPWTDISALRLEDANGRAAAFAPPAFADALAFLKDRTITQIDFKRTTRFEDVIAEIRRQDAEDRVVLIAYSMAQAQKLARLAPEMTISLSLDDEAALDRAVAAGVDETRVFAFTGTEAPARRLNRVLDARDVEVIFGTLGGRDSIDRRIAADGDESAYAAIAETGVDIIATDRPVEAHQALAAAGRGLTDGVCGATRG